MYLHSYKAVSYDNCRLNGRVNFVYASMIFFYGVKLNCKERVFIQSEEERSERLAAAAWSIRLEIERGSVIGNLV